MAVDLLSKVKAFALVAVLLGSFLLLTPLPASATSPLVQQKSGGCNSCSSAIQTVTFTNPVSSGDVLVVAIASFVFNPSASGVTDTFGSSFSQAAFICDPHADLQCAQIDYATAASSGVDTITVTYPGTPFVSDIFVYELSGVKTTGVATGTGNAPAGGSTAVSVSPLSFTNLGFIVGVVNTLGSNGYSPGPSFTASPPSSGSSQGFAEYAVSGISSPSTVPATFSSPGDWASAALELNLAASPPVQHVSLPPVIPQTLTFSFNFANSPNLSGRLVSLYGNGILYNVPGYNSSTDIFPYVLSFCSVPGANEIQISGFGSAGPGNNSSEIFVSNWVMTLTSSQGWPTEPTCAT